MATFPSLKGVYLLFLLATVASVNGQSLNPKQDIVLPASGSADHPLEWLGANGPWYAGPDVHGVSNEVPEGCTVEQAAYVVRHGSRYPDQGAYNGWVTLYQKFQAANFQATGSLAFLKDWKPVLTNPTVQIAQESLTGYKESYDLGYTLRLRYPDFYQEGSKFWTWANLYPRVVQTARMFVRGYLGPNSDVLGTVITVNSTGSPQALGDSLSPSDLCPNFVDGNGGTYATSWDNVYLPPIAARLNKLITGNLTLTASDVSNFPYLCGFESQILGKLSPMCGIFTSEELKDYEYRQDLRYYYGTGPGTGLAQTMMYPFLNNLVGLLAQGPGITGKTANGSSFPLPNLLMAFANDGQLNELATAVGVFGNQKPLSGTQRPDTWEYVSSRFVSMRGTVAFERLNCLPGAGKGSGSGSSTSSRASGSSSKSITATLSTSTISTAITGSSKSITQSVNSGATGNSGSPTSAVSNGSGASSKSTGTMAMGSSGSSPSTSTVTAGQVVTVTKTVTSLFCPTSSSHERRAVSANETYIRILFNDAVYPVTGCQDGPGKSCLMSSYVALISSKYIASGNWHDQCNVTDPNSPKNVKGASFFTNLGLSWLNSVVP